MKQNTYYFHLGTHVDLASQEVLAFSGIENLKNSGSNSDLYSIKDNLFVLKSELKDDEVAKWQASLGGSMRIMQEIAVFEGGNWLGDLEQYLADDILEKNGYESKKFNVAINVLRLEGREKSDVKNISNRLKAYLREKSINMRYIYPKEGDFLSSAQTWQNKLALFNKLMIKQSKGAEYTVLGDGKAKRLLLTLTVQNIDAYTKRDFYIPRPDPVSGMLPPKLAQIMVNLARHFDFVYDPFCGNGRVVEEAMLMGVPAIGSDIEKVKVDSAIENELWLRSWNENIDLKKTDFWVMDATSKEAVAKYKEYVKENMLGGLSGVIVSEPFLGKPMRHNMTVEEEQVWLNELFDLYGRFFTNWSGQNIDMIMVFPKVKLANGKTLSLYEKMVDRMPSLGYSSKLQGCYFRPNSFVIREIVKLTSK